MVRKDTSDEHKEKKREKQKVTTEIKPDSTKKKCIHRKLTGEKVYSTYLDYFKRRDLKYRVDTIEPYCCHATFFRENREIELPDLVMSFKINFDAQCVFIRTMIMQEFLPHNRRDVMEFITRKNSQFVFGKYLMDSQFVSFHYNVEFSHINKLTDELMERSILISLETLRNDEVELFQLMMKPKHSEDTSNHETNSDLVTIQKNKQEKQHLSQDSIFQLIRNKMSSMDYKYTIDDGKYKLRANFQIPPPLNLAQLFINVLDGICLFRFELAITVPEANRAKMNDVLSKLNYRSLVLGNFEMSPQDGRVFFRYALSYEHIAKIDGDLIEHFIRETIDSFDTPDPEFLEILLEKSFRDGKQSKEKNGKLIFFTKQKDLKKDD